MKNLKSIIFATIFVAFLFSNSLPIALACGPSSYTPVFDYARAPENPYKNYASGKIGIVKPTYPRIVLFAAYRYLNGGAFSVDEQKGLVEAWEAYFNNKDFRDDKTEEAIKGWVLKRKIVFPKEKTLPNIYVERSYGGYDFFPNCTANAFEVATETLNKRISSYGSEDKNVQKWVLAQDEVFQNCASGKKIPTSIDASMPEWLQKDRKYQIAAAAFYSMDFAKAKDDFAEIANDSDSPWQDVASYLVGRTLIRQASLTKNKNQTESIYLEAEQTLETVVAKGGEYTDSAEKLIGLIKYRIRPKERVHELAQNLTFYGDSNFRQNLIDYTWLLDKFEANSLKTEEKRIEELKKKDVTPDNLISDSNTNNNSVSTVDKNDSPDSITNSANVSSNAMKEAISDNGLENQFGEDKLTVRFYNDNYEQSWVIKVDLDATDEDTFAEAEKVAGQLTDKMKENIRSARESAYQSRFSSSIGEEYEGGYFGEVKRSIELLPDFLRSDDLSDWLFTFQIEDQNAYLYSLSKYEQNKTDLWLMTAISKAKANSLKVDELIQAAKNTDRLAAAYPTIAYHLARLLIEKQNKTDAINLIDEILSREEDIPISTRNQFIDMRFGLAETLDEFLKYSLKKPFTISNAGYSVSLDEELKLQKSYYDPQYDKITKAEYEENIEENFRNLTNLKDEKMLDHNAVDIINQNFSTKLLIDIQKSSIFPNYLKHRLAKVIWARAILLNDYKTADLILPEILKVNDKMNDSFTDYKNAKTPIAKKRTALFLILKNPELTPYLTPGFGPPEDNYSGGTQWWCSLSDEEWDDSLDKMVPRKSNKPSFLSNTERELAQNELKKINEQGGASEFLTDQVLEWARTSPKDEKIPESLYIVYEANGWDKYGCGESMERREKLLNFMKKKYPNNKWTITATENEQ